MFQKRVYSKICDSKELFGYGSRTIPLEEDWGPPPPPLKLTLNLTLTRGKFSSGAIVRITLAT